MASGLHEEVVVVGIIWDPPRKNMNNPSIILVVMIAGGQPKKDHDLQLIKIHQWISFFGRS